MDSNQPVFEISSDEEDEGLQENENLDWLLSEFWTEEVEKEGDEVVVLDERSSGLGNPNKRFKAWESKDEDDECVILDGDPDKPVTDDNESGAGHGSDELLIVGEKGQIACRDYPHPRHLCLKFPFGSTPHEKLCDLCHCYVCDAPAPCLHWGLGISINDHCHATDKITMWVDLRANVKKIKKIPAPVLKIPQPNQAPQRSVFEPDPSFSMLPAVRVCSSATNIPPPNIISQGRSQKSGSGYFLPRNKFQPHLVSEQLLNTHTDITPQERGSQCISSSNVLKRPGSIAGNQSGYYSSLRNTNHTPTSQYSRNHRSMRCQERDGGMLTRLSYSQPNTTTIFTNAVPSQPQLYSQPQPQPNGSQNIGQSGNMTQNIGGDFSFSWVNSAGLSNQQQPLVEALQVQSTEQILDLPPAMEFDPQLVASTNPCSPYYEFENWLVQNQSNGAGAPPVCSVPCDSKILSPESSYFDEGLPLFDFETPWDACAAFNP